MPRRYNKNKDSRELLRPMFVRDVPETARHKFRLACMGAGYTMQDVIVGVMKYLNDAQKVKEFME